MAVYRLRVPKTKIGYGLRTLSTVAENGLFLRLRSLFTVYEVRSLFTVYGCRKRTLSTVAEVFHNEVSLSPCLFTKNYTGDFEIAPPNTLFMCILRCTPCVRVLGYRIMFPST